MTEKQTTENIMLHQLFETHVRQLMRRFFSEQGDDITGGPDDNLAGGVLTFTEDSVVLEVAEIVGDEDEAGAVLCEFVELTMPISKLWEVADE